VRYSGIQQIQQIQLDVVVRYKRDIVDTWIQWDTVGYNGCAAKWLDIDRYRDILQGDTGGIQGNTGRISKKYTPVGVIPRLCAPQACITL